MIFSDQVDGYIQAIRDLDMHPEAQKHLCDKICMQVSTTLKTIDLLLAALQPSSQNYETVEYFKSQLLETIEQEKKDS